MRMDKQIKKSLKQRTSLSYKLTAYFVAFGIIIGYSVFLFSTAYNGRNFLQHLSSLVEHEIINNEKYFDDFNELHFKRILEKVYEQIDHSDFPIRETGFYIKEDGDWVRYSYIDKVLRTEHINIEDEPLLQKALTEGTAFSNIPFLGKADVSKIYFNLTPPGGPEMAASAEIRREGFDQVLEEDSTELCGFAIIIIIFSFLLGKLFAYRITKPISKLAVNAVRIAEGSDERSLIFRRRDEIGTLSRALGHMQEDLSERLKAMEIMNKIDKAVLSSISRNDLLTRVVGFVCDYIDKSTVVMALRDEPGEGFELSSAVRQAGPAIMIDNPYIPDELLGPDTKKEFYTPGVFSKDRNLTEVLIKQLKLPRKTKRFYNVPIYLKEEYLGSLLIIKSDQQAFSEEQKQTLKKLGDQVGVALQSVKSVEDINNLQMGSIVALSRAIDAKSEWTAGHSERVAKLSVKLAGEAGMDETTTRRLIMSALLHDIGKIGIPEAILDKPGKLTDEEFELIKQHPDKGYRIIEHIPEYGDISDGIRYHHERWNGCGYPSGLKEKEIPLFARIIAVADVFDALSADRPYRSGMSEEKCLDFIRERKGTDFDPELAETFVRMMAEDSSL